MTESFQPLPLAPNSRFTGLSYATEPRDFSIGDEIALTLRLHQADGRTPAAGPVPLSFTFPVGDQATDLTTAADAVALTLRDQAAGAATNAVLNDDGTATLTAQVPHTPAVLDLRLEHLRLNAAVGTAGLTLTGATDATRSTPLATLDIPKAAFTLTNLTAHPPQAEKCTPVTLRWDLIGADAAQYTMSYAGPRTPLRTINPGDHDQIDPRAREWQTPALDDWVVTFFLSADIKDERHLAAVPVYFSRASVELGNLDAKGVVAMLAPPQYLFDEVTITGKYELDQDTREATSGIVDGREIEPTPLSALFPDGLRTYTAPSDGVLVIHTALVSAGTDPMTVRLTVRPDTPLPPASLTANSPAPPPLNDRDKEWTVTCPDSLTLPIAAGSTLELAEPEHHDGEDTLTLHWYAFGGPNPLHRGTA